MSGTAFNPGQMSEFTSSVSGAVATALPKVAARFGNPKAVLAGIKDKSEILAGRLEDVLEGVIKSMLSLIRRPQRSVTISERRDPDVYYRTRPGLYVYGDFRDRVVSKAKSVEAGTIFKVNEDELGETLNDEQIENGLPKKHLFDESAVGAVIAEMIESGQFDKKCFYLLYTQSCVVHVLWYSDDRGWGVSTWHRAGHRWYAGDRVLSPAN
jgi:hypothetical protein